MPDTRRKQQINIGPFYKGLDRFHTFQSTLTSDENCDYLKNLDPTEQGLRARRGWRYVPTSGGGTLNTGALRYDLLGTYTDSVNGWTYGILGKVTGASSTVIYKTKTGVVSGDYTECGTYASEFCASVEYNGVFYLVPRYNLPAGSLSKAITGSAFTGGTSLTSIPSGNKAFIWKDRLWVVNYDDGIIYYSKATDPTNFTAPDGGFFKLGGNSGGDPINDVVVYSDTLLIFQRNAYYQFQFTSDPATDGYLREVSSETGAYTVLLHEDRLYVANPNGVFQYINGSFVDIAQLMNFDFKAAYIYDMHLSVNNGMLILGLNTTAIDPLYDCWAMNLQTGGWCGYEFGESNFATLPVGIGPFGKSLSIFDGTYRRNIYGDKRTFLNYSVDRVFFTGYEYKLADLRTSGHWWSPEYSFISKGYDLGDSGIYKKMHGIKVEGYSTFVLADADMSWRIALNSQTPNPDDMTSLTTQISSIAPGSAGDVQGRSVVFPRFRFRSFNLKFSKDKTDLGLVEPAEYRFEMLKATASVTVPSSNEITRADV
jgi:hypothetical protein